MPYAPQLTHGAVVLRCTNDNVSAICKFQMCIRDRAYTPLGYLRVFALEITFLMVPVTLGAILLGPAAGAVLGGVFGLTSFATCFSVSGFGDVLLSINPVFTFLVCVPTRLSLIHI